MTASPKIAARNCEQFLSGPTLSEIEAWPAAVSVPKACEAIGISQSWGYQLIVQDEFPVRIIALGTRKRVLTASLLALLRGEG